MTGSVRSSSSLFPIGYALAALFVLLPLIELTLSIWPWQPRVLLWRFGSFGLLAQSMMIPTFGMFIAILTAGILEHRRTRIVLSVVTLLFATALLVSTCLFLLDAVQARGSARPELRGSIAATAIRAAGAALLYACTWLWMSVAAFRSARRPAVAGERRRTRASLLGRMSRPATPAAPPAK